MTLSSVLLIITWRLEYWGQPHWGVNSTPDQISPVLGLPFCSQCLILLYPHWTRAPSLCFHFALIPWLALLSTYIRCRNVCSKGVSSIQRSFNNATNDFCSRSFQLASSDGTKVPRNTNQLSTGSLLLTGEATDVQKTFMVSASLFHSFRSHPPHHFLRKMPGKPRRGPALYLQHSTSLPQHCPTSRAHCNLPGPLCSSSCPLGSHTWAKKRQFWPKESWGTGAWNTWGRGF